MLPLEIANATYQDFIEQFQSLMLGTFSQDGIPNVSYAPFVIDKDKTIYIYVSGLSAHTENLTAIPKASVIFIEDDQKVSKFLLVVV